MFKTLPTAFASGFGAVIDGKLLPPAEALALLSHEPHLLCHAAFLVQKLALAADAGPSQIRAAMAQPHFDVAELFAFTCPAVAAVPTPQGLARSLMAEEGETPDHALRNVATDLLARLANQRYPHLRETAQAANALARDQWPWGQAVMQALLQARSDLNPGTFGAALNVWDRLEEWEEEAPRPQGRNEPVTSDEAYAILREALGHAAEPRPTQRAYAASAIHAFAPREQTVSNNILLAEAGTGLGKTLGYLSPAWAWSKKNARAVWLSTYTKNLQRQLDQETTRVIPEPEERRLRVVIRKGRENYLCLLNMQESFGRLQASGPRHRLLAVLLARWARNSRDGDLIGGDFPSWIFALFPEQSLDGAWRFPSPQGLGLTDRRGECIYVACPHYKRCFIEKSVRAGRQANLVIANHALVLQQAAVDFSLGQATTEEESNPGGLKRIVFDEGHHLFEAADSAFSSHLTAQEAVELRRWIRGPETERRRGRGLAERLNDLTSSEDHSEQLLQEILHAARGLPPPGVMHRLAEGLPHGAAEKFFALLRQQVLARNTQSQSHSIETDCLPLLPGMEQAITAFVDGLLDLRLPMIRLATVLTQKLDDDAADLNTHERGRIEAMARSLRRRGELMLGGWIAMLQRLLAKRDPLFVEWFDIEQQGRREIDAGFHSHWVDPTNPLAQAVLRPADGVLITSATLKDRPPDVPGDWENAEMRTGVTHLPYTVKRESFDSPFNYQDLARILVVTDVARDNMDQLAAAYRELFIASKGGALGLFTAISRLRAVHQRIIRPLSEKGLGLYAQHIDPMDTATLVDLFRAENDACLLGTDAVRDGVDVPGDSLRLIVMDRVPWATPTILERARKDAFGGALWQDMTVRLRLRQAFGRLIRTDKDRGCFVLLDSRLASRFATAFPSGMKIERMGLVDALEAVAGFCNKR